MKLILTHEVDGLGAPGDIVEVKDGYGRNFLVPRSLAMPWSRGAEKQITQIKRARDARAIRGVEHANEVKNQLEGLAVTLPVKAGETGKLFGSVTTADVADAVRTSGGPLIEKRAVTLDHSIKSVGSHNVEIKLHPSVTAIVSIEVIAAN
ncbi:MAG: 50S ribosomal protein L9 [Candidatus Nanopelagicales bacterium]|nr:50S ribosomal protein L9 [Candidatus Nanopelagicales bacterium]